MVPPMALMGSTPPGAMPKPQQPAGGVSALQGLFGNLVGSSGNYASVNPNQFNAPKTGAMNVSDLGIDWKGWGSSPLKANIDEAIGRFGKNRKRDLFGQSGIGGLFGRGGSALARSGLMSSSGLDRLGQELSGDLTRSVGDYSTQALGEGLRTFGTYGTSDLNRKLAGMTQNQDTASRERYGDLNRLQTVLSGNANRRQSGIDRQTRTRGGLFDTLFNEQQAQRQSQQSAARLPLDILMKIMSGSGTTSSGSTSGANPFLSNLFSGVGSGAGEALSGAIFN